jgi:hypothetical protein
MRVVLVAAFVLSVVSSVAQAQPSPMLAAQLQQRALTQASGLTAMGPPVAGMLAKKQVIKHFIVMEAGRCYTALGVAGPGVKDFDLELFSPLGPRVAADKGYDAAPQLQYCALIPGGYRLEIAVKSGAGEVAVQVWSTQPPYAQPQQQPQAAAAPPAPADPYQGGSVAPQPQQPPPAYPPPAPPQPGADPLSAAVDDQARTAAPGQRRVSPIFAGAGNKGQHGDWQVPLEAGRCYTFIGIGGAGVVSLAQYLWDPVGKRVTDMKTKSPLNVMPFCPTLAGPYHLQAKVDKGGGEFRAAVYAQ